MAYIKNDQKPLQKSRLTVQVLFALLCIWIGIEFFLFVRYFETVRSTPYYTRPPGVDGFLPISSLMNLVYFFRTGIIHEVHPAGFFIFVSILLMSLVFAKSFCSWLCPVGLLSEKLADLGEWLFKRKFRMPRIADYILRSIKYFLLGFLIYVLSGMSLAALKSFLDGGYNIVADIKMYYFFANMDIISLVVVICLMLFSIFFRGFWCRYLCPYGALLGIAGLLSPSKIRRNESSCIDCTKCAKACPSFIRVDKVKTVISDECTSCMKCVDACPVKDTLYAGTAGTRMKWHKKYVMLAVLAIFMGMTGLGMLLGKWQNKVSKETYMELYQIRNTFKHH